MSSDIAARLQADVIAAMKARDKDRLGVLRQLQAAIKQVEIDERTELDDEGVLKVLMTYAKKVRDSLESAENANREDLAANARDELTLVQTYLPAALADDELAAIVDEVIAETGATSPRDMGQVIKGVMARVTGRAEGARVSAMVKSKLVGWSMIVWITVALIAVCAVYGWRAGVVRRLLELVGLIVALLASARFASAVAPKLDEMSALDDTSALLASYFLVFLAALVAVRFLAKAIASFVRWTPLGWLDRLGGAVCGALIGALLISLGLIAVSQAPNGAAVRDTFIKQPAGDLIYHAAPTLYQGARQLFGGEVDELWERAVELKDKVVEEAERATADDS